MKKKNSLVLLITFVILIIILLTASFTVVRVRENNRVKNKIMNVAKRFYEKSYYQIIDKKTLKQLTNKGIIISLKELIEYEEISAKDYTDYNLSKSEITIYPISPYKEKNYKIKIKLYRK